MIHLTMALGVDVYLPDKDLVFRHTSDKNCFQVYIQEARVRARNLEGGRFKIITTKSMYELYTKVLNNKVGFQYLLSGNTGVGKTTTIFWLYCQLRQHRDREVFALRLHLGDIEEVRARFATVQEKQIILLADLNRLQVAEPLVLLGLLDCLYAIAERDGVCIFAGSGSIKSTLLTCNASIRGYIKNLMVCLVEYPISLDKQAAQELMKQVCPERDENDRDERLKALQYNFLGISLLSGCSTQQINFFFVEHVWKDSTRDLMHTSNLLSLSMIRKLYLALCFGFPLNSFDTMEESVIMSTVPVLNGLIRIDSEDIPRLTVPVPLGAIRNDISSLSKSLPSTDEASAIGFLYESAILNHLSGAYQKCSKNHQISVFSLPFLVRSPSRFAPEAEVELSKNMLWATPKQERAIDAVTLCENVLVLIQVSIQKTHHKQKLEKLIQLPKYLVRLVKKCQEVVYIYVNPMIDTNEETLKTYYDVVITSLKRSSWERKPSFAIATSEMKSKMLLVYRDIALTLNTPP